MMRPISAMALLLTVSVARAAQPPAANSPQPPAANVQEIAAPKKPVVLVFDLNPGAGAGAEFVRLSTQDLKVFLRETNRVDAVQYIVDSPVVQRAILEKAMTGDEANSPTAPEQRLKMAKLFGAQYYAGGDVSATGGNVDLTLSLTEVSTGRKWTSQPRTSLNSVQSGDSNRDLANARASAIRTAVTQISQQALAALPEIAPEPAQQSAESGDKLDEKAMAERFALVDRYLKEDNAAGAISELKRIINSDPKAIEPRTKLANVYLQQKKYDQAVDELKRALDLAPGNQDIQRSLAAAYEAQGSRSDALGLYNKLLEGKDPVSTGSLRIALGDTYWRSAKIEDAVSQYKSAAEANPKDPTPHLRLARVYAAKAQFTEGAKEIEAAKKLTLEGSPVMDSETFQGFLKVADIEIRAIYAQYQSGDAAFRAGDRTREDYYTTAKELGARAAALAAFLDVIPPPDEFGPSKRHRVLGLTLFSQGASSLMTYLQSDDTDARADSTLYITEAVKEFQTAFALDKKTLEKSK